MVKETLVARTPFAFESLPNEQWTPAQCIALWKAARKGKLHMLTVGGSILALYDVPGTQRFAFGGLMHWNYASRPRQQSIIFDSHCVVCGAPYRFNVPTYFKTVVRTCSNHRGQWRAPKPYREPRAKLDKKGPGIVQRALIAEHEARDLAGLPCDADTICAALEAQGICTKGNATRAYRTLQSRGLLD